MNNMPFPYLPPNFNYHLEKYIEEINKLKYEINKLKERITNLEKKEKKDYLKKDDSLYMM